MGGCFAAQNNRHELLSVTFCRKMALQQHERPGQIAVSAAKTGAVKPLSASCDLLSIRPKPFKK
jgi:hypothetical protein